MDVEIMVVVTMIVVITMIVFARNHVILAMKNLVAKSLAMRNHAVKNHAVRNHVTRNHVTRNLVMKNHAVKNHVNLIMRNIVNDVEKILAFVITDKDQYFHHSQIPMFVDVKKNKIKNI